MTSREYAKQLHDFAEQLEMAPEFPVPDYLKDYEQDMSYLFSKDQFVAAVRALGSGTKEIKGDSMIFHPTGATFSLRIERSAVCKMTRPAQWSCEPWLTDEQQVIVDQAAAAQISDEGMIF